MTVEAETRMALPANVLPAGWYTDPGKSGGKRWWDGKQWTDHLQMPAAKPTAAARQSANPYPAGFDQTYTTARIPVLVRVSNRAAWLSLLFGVAALGLTVVSALPGSPIIWVSGVGVVAVIWGIRALARLRSGRSTIVWAPILGMLLGIVATISMVLGIGLMSLAGSIGPQSPAAGSSPSVVSPPKTSPEPFVFPSNSQLTADEVAVQTLATAVNRAFAGGNSKLATGQAWPTSLTMSGSNVLTATGKHVATLPAGLTAHYQLATNGSSYQIAVTGENTAELATYNSGSNGFSWGCLATDTNCTPSN